MLNLHLIQTMSPNNLLYNTIINYNYSLKAIEQNVSCGYGQAHKELLTFPVSFPELWV